MPLNFSGVDEHRIAKFLRGLAREVLVL